MSSKPLRAPGAKAVVLPPIRPNAGVQAAYKKKLERMVEEMHASLVYWLSAQWKANPPTVLAADGEPRFGSYPGGSPAAALRKSMRQLSRRWNRKFDKGAEELAKYFTDKAIGGSDLQLQQILKKSGFSVSFQMTEAARDAYQAVLGENVGLIKSIASQHLSQVEGIVMRSVTAGRDLGTLTKELEARYGVTKRRAAFIARDQNNKATATITRIRQESLGITEAEWLHSSGGKTQRPSHVAANGKRYDVSKGMLIDGEYIRPGEKPGCRCVSRSVIPGFED